ncbi:MAG: response regulator [Mariprofundus sp.]|nr:response regulator [Mariprofundus sp.]
MMVLNTSAQRTLLLVDDDPLLTELFGEILGELYAIKTADSVVAAQHVIERDRIDMVISDYHLGLQDGDDLLAWILLTKPTLAEHFILLTGDDSANLNALKGMVTVLYKPVQIAVLLDTIEQMFQPDKEVS